MATLREQKEAFVSGHAGTSLAEVSALAAAPVVLLLLWRLLRPPTAGGTGLFHRARPTAGGLALEFAALVLPQVAHLLGLATPATLMGAAAALALALFVTQHSDEWQQRSRNARRQPLTEQLREALTSYRASLMLITYIAILGVDFHAFPRRFAKAETFGTGLMDAGVGSFVAASGLAHGLAAAARPPGQRGPRWRKEAGRAAALLALGLGRLAATSATDYQNHASEYGLHWNFFLTLAALRLLGMLLPTASRSASMAAAAGTAVLAAHQYGLSAWQLIDVVHADERGSDLLSANKEGLLSLPGYWALQLLGTAAGTAAYHLAGVAATAKNGNGSSGDGSVRSPHKSSSGKFGGGLRIRTSIAPPPSRAPQLRLVAQLAAGTAALWLAYWATATFLQPVSRRACNAAYVLWMLALNTQCVALFAAANALLPGASPHLLSAVDSTMLPVFLAANVLTGLVNLSINTLAASDAIAVLIVAAYIAALCGGAVLAHQRRQRL